MRRNRTNSRLADGLLIELRRDGAVPFQRQIQTSIQNGIGSGRLPPGSSLPPTRALAADLGVSRGVVVEAYEQLVAEGYLISRMGGYTQIAPERPRSSARVAPPQMPRIDFRYGRADVSLFPRTAWLRSVRRVFIETASERFNYLPGRGLPELHDALASYLNRVRGTSARPDHIVICSGYAQGLRLVMQVLAASGARRIAVEDPSSDDNARVAESEGLEVVGVPTGDDGLRVDALDQIAADAIVLTPSHQWPTGAVLSAEARARVVSWATRRRALIVEDDYDSEYRYDRDPIAAMQGMAPDHVVYAGTASKTLAPGLRLGWLVVPGHLVDAIAARKLAADRGSPVIDQLTFADFLDHGEFDRQLRRKRPVYRRRRDTLLQAIERHVPELRPTGVSAGFHLVAWLPPDLDEESVIAAAARRGVGVYGVAPYRLSRGGDPGLIFGYAGLDETTITEGVEILGQVIATLRPRSSPRARRQIGALGRRKPR
jgi:GntR family transcriptional regulator / MocR family aminotransferase